MIALDTIPLLVMCQLVSCASHAVLQSNLKQQIASNKGHVNKIIDHVLIGNGQHVTYDKLAVLGDKFGSRLTGSAALEQAIDYTVEELRKEGFDNVHTEPVTVPKWVRGEEWAKMIEPRTQRLSMLGLGMSVGTNGTELEAEVVVVNSFDGLKELGELKVRGKIVVYNQPWKGYSQTVVYRRIGASEAAKLGAVGVLIRSLTTFSLSTPHTGIQNYAPNVTQIPAASISIEDADMLNRMYLQEYRIKIRMYMEAKFLGNATSRNVIADITGSEFPNSLIILGGHIDSWDVGTGSMDDGGGVMIAWQALSVIKNLRLRPRRTLRLVLWTGEEQGIFGGDQFYDAHKSETDNVSLVIESDHGAMKPKGIRFSGGVEAKSILEEACSLLAVINTTIVLASPANVMGADTRGWVKAGVPGIELYSHNENYFHFHHTIGDTLNVLDPDDLDLCTILWSSVSLVVANLDSSLPRSIVRDIVSNQGTSRFNTHHADWAIAVTVALGNAWLAHSLRFGFNI